MEENNSRQYEDLNSEPEVTEVEHTFVRGLRRSQKPRVYVVDIIGQGTEAERRERRAALAHVALVSMHPELPDVQTGPNQT